MLNGPKVVPARDTRNDESNALAQAALKAALEKCGSQANLARSIGVDQATVSRWGAGKAPVDIVAVLRARAPRQAVLDAMLREQQAIVAKGKEN